MSTVPNSPAGRPVPAINPTGVGGAVASPQNAPLTQLPATTAAKINWVPNSGPQPNPTATAPVASNHAGILAADGSIIAGSDGPPYVAGNVTVGQNQVGTSVILTPR